MFLRTVSILVLVLSTSASHADEWHPLMDSKWWLTAGSFFAERDFKASAQAGLDDVSRKVDFEGSAGVDNFSGSIWNVAAGVGYRLTDHIGIGLNYQFFELSVDLTEPNWRGEVTTTFTGPHLHLSGYW